MFDVEPAVITLGRTYLFCKHVSLNNLPLPGFLTLSCYRHQLLILLIEGLRPLIRFYCLGITLSNLLRHL